MYSYTGNPSFEGWIFEFDIDAQLQNAFSQGRNFTTVDSYWPVNCYLEYNDPRSLVKSVRDFFWDGEMPKNKGKYLWAKTTDICLLFNFLI